MTNSEIVGLAEHEKCGRCEREYRMWFAPSPLWNAVMRGGCINGPWEFGEMICANCFMDLAEERGIASNFRVIADDVKVPLQTVTPSGRVWDDKRNLWLERSRPRTVAVQPKRRRTIEMRK
jgi:hypothetical protein